jgi:hypothetical protein
VQTCYVRVSKGSIAGDALNGAACTTVVDDALWVQEI